MLVSKIQYPAIISEQGWTTFLARFVLWILSVYFERIGCPFDVETQNTRAAMNRVSDFREKRIEDIRGYISRMPSLPITAAKVLEVCNDPEVSPHALNRVISLDPVLTGQVLGLINSAYYSLPKKTTSLARAIIMLGINTVKNLALSTAIIQRIGTKSLFKTLSAENFWIHSLCVGVLAKTLAAIKGVPAMEREGYFVAGLLHDLGKIPLNSLFPREYSRILKSAESWQIPLHSRETAVFEMDHGTVGKMLAEKWGLGDTINETIFHHHSPGRAEKRNCRFVAIVALANAAANTFGIGSAGDHYPEDLTTVPLLELVGIEWDAIVDLRDSILREIEKAKIFLQVNRKEQHGR